MADEAIFIGGKRNLLNEVFESFGIGRGAAGNNGIGGNYVSSGTSGTSGTGIAAGAAAAGIIAGLKEQQNNKDEEETPQNPNLNAGQKPNITPIIPTPENTIEDKTEENIETPITQTDWKQWYLDRRAEEWERQDTAYSRAIADLRKSGVNVNLLGNIQPAQSIAGDTSVLVNDLNNQFDMIMQEIEHAFEGDIKQQDRFYEMLKNAMTALLAYGTLTKK